MLFLWQVEEVLSPLGIALESVLEYVRMWTPEGSPLCHERAQRAAADTPIPCNPRTNNGGGETQIGIHRCTGTSAECLHRAVWTQAETLGARAQLIFRRGEEAVTMIHQKVCGVSAGEALVDMMCCKSWTPRHIGDGTVGNIGNENRSNR